MVPTRMVTGKLNFGQAACLAILSHIIGSHACFANCKFEYTKGRGNGFEFMKQANPSRAECEQFCTNKARQNSEMGGGLGEGSLVASCRYGQDVLFSKKTFADSGPSNPPDDSCKSETEKYCSPGQRWYPCLLPHRDDVSGPCLSYMRVKEQFMGMAGIYTGIFRDCETDRKRLCSQFAHDTVNTSKCLLINLSKLDGNCKQSVNDRLVNRSVAEQLKK
jgi:hypothetical protein